MGDGESLKSNLMRNRIPGKSQGVPEEIVGACRDTAADASSFPQNAILLHEDPEFEALRGQVSLEALPYKGS